MTFEIVREAEIKNLGITYQEYSDPQTGAKHIHLKTESPENAFMVSFPTVPHSDDGRAHILEHLSLCGSKRYPTRDPFFSMLRRSLATFMNAMTYPDRTVYPFATQDRKDFFNLLDVYLDATFHPNLDPLDFKQEGWRYAYDKDGKLAINGVVFNEMKEPIVSPMSVLWHGLSKALKPGTTYAYESGGDPLAIPNLTHEQIVEFHRAHYHPSRAVFWSFGNIEPAAIQARIAELALAGNPEKLARIEPDSAEPPSSARKVEIKIPSQGEPNEHGFQIAWLLGDSAKDHDAINDWQIFLSAIAGDDSSPMSMALEGAGFGRPGICHLDSDSKQCALHFGMEGLTERETAKAREIILSTLEGISRDGIEHSRLVNVLRDFELQSLEIRGGRTPYCVNALLSMVSLELNGGDPLRALDVSADLAKAEKDIQDPEFIKKMARALLDSPARVEAKIIPDPGLVAAREKAEAAMIEQASKQMGPKEMAAIRRDSELLQERQRSTPDLACLPKILPSEISRQLPPSLESSFQKGGPDTPARCLVEAPTNGVGYFGAAIDASRIPEADWPWLDLGAQLCMTLGFGSKTFDEASAYRDSMGSGFACSLEAAKAAESSGSDLAPRLKYGARSLEREAASMAQALCETLKQPRFDERDRIAYYIQSTHQAALQNISGSGAGLAAGACAAQFGAAGRFSAATSGLENLKFLAELASKIQTEEGFQEIKSKLESVFEALSQAPCLLSYAGSSQAAAQAFEAAAAALGPRKGFEEPTSVESPILNGAEPAPLARAIMGPGQLNYCHASWQTPQSPDPDCGPLMVLGAYLRNTFLHRALREEGGAYGGSANMNASTGQFSMSSYRDPRLAGTYADFNEAVKIAVEGDIRQDDLDEAIVSVMQGLDKPGTPREQAAASIARTLGGIEDGRRLALRRSILECSAEGLKNAANRHLLGKTPHKAAYVCPKSSDEAAAIGLGAVDAMAIAAGKAKMSM